MSCNLAKSHILSKILPLPLFLVCGVMFSLTSVGCGEVDGTDPQAEEGWTCTVPRDGHERCDGGSVVWCHGVADHGHDSAHFHEGDQCAEDGKTCVELSDEVAACRDAADACDAGEVVCVEDDAGRQYAKNCVDGAFATKRCSIAEDCVATEDFANCEPKAPQSE